MAASPRSSASSTLYSSSDPPQYKLPVQELPVRKDSSQAVDTDSQPEEGSDMMEGLDSSSEDSNEDISSAASRKGTAQETSLKRKRDDETIAGPHEQGVTSIGGARNNSVPPEASSWRPYNGNRFARKPMDMTNGDPEVKQLDNHGQILAAVEEPLEFVNTSAVPAAVWQYIFCLVPPVYLGCLLRVNRAFNSYLTPGDLPSDHTTHPQSIAQPVSAEAIWTASRRRFARGLPRPLFDKHELDMWRLLRGHRCQLCGDDKGAFTPSTPEDSCRSEPGDSSVRVIWPFAIRCCGTCLQDVSYKVPSPVLHVLQSGESVLITKQEVDLYLLPDYPAFLLEGIPFALVSADSNYIKHHLAPNFTASPALGWKKYYYKPMVHEIKKEFDEARALGSASAAEWIKGLAGRGQKCLEEIIRWEQWESKGGLKKVNARHSSRSGISAAMSIRKVRISPKDEHRSDSSTPQSAIAPQRDGLGTASVYNLQSMTTVPQPPMAAFCMFMLNFLPGSFLFRSSLQKLI